MPSPKNNASAEIQSLPQDGLWVEASDLWQKHLPMHVHPSSKMELLVYETREGEILAAQSICPHMGSRLEWNEEKNHISCPWHPLDFDSHTGKSPHCRYKSIQLFNVTYQNHRLYFSKKT